MQVAKINLINVNESQEVILQFDSYFVERTFCGCPSTAVYYYYYYYYCETVICISVIQPSVAHSETCHMNKVNGSLFTRL